MEEFLAPYQNDPTKLQELLRPKKLKRACEALPSVTEAQLRARIHQLLEAPHLAQFIDDDIERATQAALDRALKWREIDEGRLTTLTQDLVVEIQEILTKARSEVTTKALLKKIDSIDTSAEQISQLLHDRLGLTLIDQTRQAAQRGEADFVAARKEAHRLFSDKILDRTLHELSLLEKLRS